jgi:phosphoribosyl 1,2-cyclic phosphodiesterase
MSDTLVFVGTGVSTGLPVLGHLNGHCNVCMEALLNYHSPNRRNNVSFLIYHAASNQNILIDCGKTFRDSFLRTLSSRKISQIDCLLLTHDHADAIDGIDDLRDLQVFSDTGHAVFCKKPIKTYLSQQTLTTLQQRIPYITQASEALKQNPNFQLPRRVTCLDFEVIQSDKEIISFTPPATEAFGGFSSLPLIHGKGYYSLGFAFGTTTKVVYLSDVSEICENTLGFLSCFNQIDILIVDCLHNEGRSHFSHFCIDQMWDLVVRLQPKRTFGVGMYCDLDHSQTNLLFKKKLKSLNSNRIESVELAYDGLTLHCDL